MQISLIYVIAIVALAFIAGRWRGKRIGLNHFTTSIDHARSEIRRLQSDPLCYRLRPLDITENSPFFDELHEYAVGIADQVRRLSAKDVEQRAVLESMKEGVIAVDSDDVIITLNSAAADLLDLNSPKAIGKSMQEAFLPLHIQKVIQLVKGKGTSIEEEWSSHGLGERFFELYVAPIISEETGRRGALVVLNDITKIKRLEIIRKDFVSNVSHELRTPVAAIMGFVETLLDGALDSKDAKRFLDIIERHANRLNRIIDDLLILSRVENLKDTEQIKMIDCRIADIVHGAGLIVENAAQAKDINIKTIGDVQVIAHVSPGLLEQAIVNLFDNAVRYSNSEGIVTVEHKLKDGVVTITVSDTGKGIPEKHLPRIFERFYRVEHGRDRDTPGSMSGTGLGLAITKHIIEVHKGTVSVSSVEGQGTCFVLSFPQGEIQSDTQPAANDLN